MSITGDNSEKPLYTGPGQFVRGIPVTAKWQIYARYYENRSQSLENETSVESTLQCSQICHQYNL